MKYNAHKILNLICQKHSRDIVIPNCKTGGTWYSNGLLILDVLVIPRSWRNMVIRAYEIKVNRSDFLNDVKWKNYLQFCNELYFVCPPRLIEPEELPTDVGLLWTSVNCNKIYTKRKAVTRDIDIPNELFLYIIMWRSIIKDGEMVNNLDKKAYWQNWLNEKKIDYNFGQMVSKKINEFIKIEIESVKNENKVLKRENDNLMEIKEFCKNLGYKSGNMWINNFLRKIEMLNNGLPENSINILKDTIVNLHQIQNLIEQYQLGLKVK